MDAGDGVNVNHSPMRRSASTGSEGHLNEIDEQSAHRGVNHSLNLGLPPAILAHKESWDVFIAGSLEGLALLALRIFYG